MAKLKLTYELIEKARKLIAAGNYTETVCQYLGISKDTWYRWLKTGERQKKGIYSDFSDAVRQAEAEAEMRNVTILKANIGGCAGVRRYYISIFSTL